MNRKFRLCSFFTILVLTFSTAVQAGKLNRQQVLDLLAGNTVEGRNLVHQKKMVWFFAKAGILRKIDDRGNAGKGGWRVDAQGFLCVKFKRFKLGKERCRVIVEKEYGGYKVIGTAHPEEGKLIWLFDRVLPGNDRDL